MDIEDLTSWEPDPQKPIKWPPKLAFDIALGGTSYDDLQAHYNLSDLELERILVHPTFRREVVNHEKEIRDNGVTFKSKAKVQAELYLENLHDIITGVDTPPSVKLDAIKSIVQWAGYQPKTDAPATNIQQKIEICWQTDDKTVTIK